MTQAQMAQLALAFQYHATATDPATAPDVRAECLDLRDANMRAAGVPEFSQLKSAYEARQFQARRCA